MAATERTIKETIASSLQWTLFGLIRDKESCEPGSEKNDDYNRAYLSNLAGELLEHVGHGRQDEAEHIIKKYPDILLFSPQRPVKDISGNLFSGTAFQYALWAMDTHMYQMMLACLPQNEQGEEIRKGLFEQAKAQTEHFDFRPLIQALQTYIHHFNRWSWEERSDYWRTAIGKAQKTLPAHVRQEYCHPNRPFLPIPDFTEKTFKRSLSLFNWATETLETWDENLQGLVSDFAISRGGWHAGMAQDWRWGDGIFVEFDLKAIIALSQVRASDLSALMQQLQIPIQRTDEIQVITEQKSP